MYIHFDTGTCLPCEKKMSYKITGYFASYTYNLNDIF